MHKSEFKRNLIASVFAPVHYGLAASALKRLISTEDQVLVQWRVKQDRKKQKGLSIT